MPPIPTPRRHLRRTLQRLARRLVPNSAGVQPRRLHAAPVVKVSKTHIDAARLLVDRPTLSTLRYRVQITKHHLDNVHPDIRTFYRRFNKELRDRGYPFFAHDLYRSPDEQISLKSRGVSRAGPGDSAHNWGCAVDIVHSQRFWDLTKIEWAIIGQIGKEISRKTNIPIIWGGDWSFYDPAHWELSSWRDIRREMKFHEIGTTLLGVPDNVANMDYEIYFATIDARVKRANSTLV